MSSPAVQVWSLIFPNGIPVEEYEYALSLALRAGVSATNGHATNGHTTNGNGHVVAEAPPPQEPEEGLSVKEAAELAKCGTAAIYAAIKSRKLVSVKSPDGRMLVNPSAVRDWSRAAG